MAGATVKEEEAAHQALVARIEVRIYIYGYEYRYIYIYICIYIYIYIMYTYIYIHNSLLPLVELGASSLGIVHWSLGL